MTRSTKKQQKNAQIKIKQIAKNLVTGLILTTSSHRMGTRENKKELSALLIFLDFYLSS